MDLLTRIAQFIHSLAKKPEPINMQKETRHLSSAQLRHNRRGSSPMQFHATAATSDGSLRGPHCSSQPNRWKVQETHVRTVQEI